MTTLSLNGRSYTDLLAMQPGVIPITTMQANSIIMAGVTGAVAPSGGLNPGNVSISGQRENANGFMVNGGDVQEHMNGGTSIVPESRLDRGVPGADEQLRSAVRQLQRRHRQRRHQSREATLPRQARSNSSRNTALDARNYFSPERAAFKQNQPGGTVGGPDQDGSKVFFFGDYQGTRTTQGIETGLIPVPSAQRTRRQLRRRGRFAHWHRERRLLGGSAVPAPRLPGVARRAVLHAGCTSASQCVFPNAAIPAQRVVLAGAAPAAVHPDAELGRRAVLDRRVRPDGARRQRLRSASTPTAGSGSVSRLLLLRRLPARQPVSRRSRAAPTCRDSTR